MAQCELLAACLFYDAKMGTMPTTATLLQKTFCLGDDLQCARHAVFTGLGPDHVPVDLYPTDAQRARDLLRGGKPL